MHLEEMERSGLFPAECLDWRDFSSAAVYFLMHLSMQEISLKRLLQAFDFRLCAVPLDGDMADTADYTDGTDMIDNNGIDIC